MAEHVSAEDLTRRGLSLDWLSSRPGAVLWVESSADTGPSVVRSLAHDGSTRTSLAVGIGNHLHAYGARPYVTSSAGVAATRASDGQVWSLETDTRLTDTEHQHGDLDADDSRICCVRESDDGDDLLVIDTATGGVDVVHRAPFLAAPRLRGDRLAWTQWSDDVMPWDAGEVWVGRYRPGARIEDRRRVAGGPGEAAHQPQWGPDGYLYLLSDRSGWWNLYRWHDELEAVAPMASECGAALWESGYASYTFLDHGRIAMIAENGPRSRIVVAEPDGTLGELVTPFTSLKPFLAPTSRGVAVIGAGPDRGPRVAVVSTDGSGATQVIRCGEAPPYTARSPAVLTVDSTEPLTVLLHPPGSGQGPAPLIVRAHPGPADNNRLRLDEEVQFFTSRGYALAEVDYRGSTGYGRRFRGALDGRWGDLDVEDCMAVAHHLVRSGQARGDAVFITGASAGAYTALRAVSRSDTPFALAVARSAVVHPNRWITTAPRFQRAHAATLAHHAADVDPAAVCRPVLLIHGRDDDVAPLDDVRELAGALGDRGCSCGSWIFPVSGTTCPDRRWSRRWQGNSPPTSTTSAAGLPEHRRGRQHRGCVVHELTHDQQTGVRLELCEHLGDALHAAVRGGARREPDGRPAGDARALDLTGPGHRRRLQGGVHRQPAHPRGIERRYRTGRLALRGGVTTEVERAVRLLVGQVGLAEVPNPLRLLGGGALLKGHVGLEQRRRALRLIATTGVGSRKHGVERGPHRWGADGTCPAQCSGGEPLGLRGVVDVQGQVSDADTDEVAAVAAVARPADDAQGAQVVPLGTAVGAEVHRLVSGEFEKADGQSRRPVGQVVEAALDTGDDARVGVAGARAAITCSQPFEHHQVGGVNLLGGEAVPARLDEPVQHGGVAGRRDDTDAFLIRPLPRAQRVLALEERQSPDQRPVRTQHVVERGDQRRRREAFGRLHLAHEIHAVQHTISEILLTPALLLAPPPKFRAEEVGQRQGRVHRLGPAAHLHLLDVAALRSASTGASPAPRRSTL